MENVPVKDCGDAIRRADDGSYGQYPVVAKTADFTILATDTGKLFSNAGAAGAVEFTVPTPKAGMWFTFLKAVVGQNLTVRAPAGVKISLSAAAGGFRNSTLETELATASVVAISDTEYAVVGFRGTWAVV